MTVKASDANTPDFPAYLEAVRPEIEATLDRLLPDENEPPGRLHQAMRYSIFAGGKRVRPALALLASDALGVPRMTVLPGAAALEMIHTYSLIHDDLPAMDDDDLRRGRPTLHRQYDEALAILAGDALLTLGMTIPAVEPPELPAERRCQAAELIGQASGTFGMIGGQVDDMAAENDWPDDAAAALEAIHRRKTGALLTACVRLAGIYAGAREEEDRLLSELGEAIGLLFQIGDDILDVEGTDAALGKTAGKDAAARKLTYPGLYGLEESKKMLARTRAEAHELAARLPRERSPRGAGSFEPLIDYLATRDH